MSLITTLLRGNILKQGSIVLFDQGFLSIANFVTGVLVARACSKEDYGIYVLAWSILLIFVSAQRALVHIPFTVYMPKLSDIEKDTYQGSTLAHTTLLSFTLFIVLTIASVSIGDTIVYRSGSIQQFGLILAALTIPLLFREYIRSILFARLDFISSLFANATATLLQLSIITYLYLKEQLNPTTAIIAILMGSIFAASIMLWTHRDKFNIKLDHITKDFKRGWVISKWMVINVLGMIGSSQAYAWLLLFLTSTQTVAVYGAAFAVSNVMAPFLRAINAYVLPRMSHGYKDDNIKTLRRMLLMSILAPLFPYGIWTITASIFADEIMVMLYTSEYAGYASIVIILLVKNMIESVSSPLTLALQTLERPEITTQSLILGALITFTLGAYLIYQYQIIGAAIATLTTTLAIATYKYFWISRIYTLKIQAV